MNLDFRKLGEDFLNCVDISNNTREAYELGIKKFVEYLNDNGIDQPTRETVIAYKEHLIANYKPATVNAYLIAIRCFFKYLAYEGKYKNITDYIKSVKDTETHKREALSIENCQKLINSCKNTREKLIIYLAISCGLRVNEIKNIELSDFKYENGKNVLYVLGKGRVAKVDFVQIPDKLMELVEKYKSEYEVKDYLFTSLSQNGSYGHTLGVRYIRKIITNALIRCGLKSETVVAHSLRHSFATISIENGIDIREVSQALRHQSTVVTERYLHDLELRDNKCSNTVSELLNI